MIRESTLFILGAGAGDPYGFPTGKKLRAQLFNLNDHTLVNIIESQRDLIKYGTTLLEENNDEGKSALKSKILSELKSFKNDFKLSSVESVDKYLSICPEFEQIGKIAITLRILESEEGSRFLEDMGERFPEDWFFYLFNQMLSGCSKKTDLEKFGSQNKVNFITFNYDRSLEFLLHRSLSKTFRELPEQAIIEQLKKFQVHHVYGKVGPLPWEDPILGVRYGAKGDFESLEKWSQNIKVVGQRVSGDSEKIVSLIGNAKRVFFLGFGFADENMDVLGIPEFYGKEQEILATGKGLGSRIHEIEMKFLKKHETNNFSVARGRLKIEESEKIDCFGIIEKHLYGIRTERDRP